MKPQSLLLLATVLATRVLAQTSATLHPTDDTSVSLPAPQAKPKKKITVAAVDDSQRSLLEFGPRNSHG